MSGMLELEWIDHAGVDVSESEIAALTKSTIARVRARGAFAQECASVGNRLIFVREDYGTICVRDCIVKRTASVQGGEKA